MAASKSLLKHTVESKAKISNWNKENGNAFAGKSHTAETKEKMKKAWALRKGKGESNLFKYKNRLFI